MSSVIVTPNGLWHTDPNEKLPYYGRRSARPDASTPTQYGTRCATCHLSRSRAGFCDCNTESAPHESRKR